MAIKVENHATIAVKALDEQVQKVVDCVPVEHLRGLSRIVFVDRISDPRLDPKLTEKLPVLYPPRAPGAPSAFGEIALAILQPPDASLFRRLAARMQSRAIVAQAVLSLVAQHYLVTVSSRKKKGPGVERAAREYIERYFKVWRDRQAGLRARLFRPLIPYLERWQKSARKYYAEQARKKAAGSR
jgi:hypothetical protein